MTDVDDLLREYEEAERRYEDEVHDENVEEAVRFSLRALRGGPPIRAVRLA